MGTIIRILIPLILFPLIRWGFPRVLDWAGRRYDQKQAEKRMGGPVIEGHLARPTRDLRSVDFDRE